MSITLSALQKQRRDTAANWTAANPTLLAGEIGIESDTSKIKIGDGTTVWNSLGYTPWSQLSAYPIVNADIASNAEIAVSKLADGAARQLLQTDAAGTGVEWTSNVDVPGTLDVTGAATFDGAVTTTGLISANGRVSFPLGSAAAPSLYPGSDVNTGIYSPGADQVAVATNGSGRLFVDASGRLLLGTSANPTGIATDFYINNTSGGTITLIRNTTPTVAGNLLGFIQFADQAGGIGARIQASAAGAWTTGTTSEANLIFNTTPTGSTTTTERLRITSAGLVGIGTSSPNVPLEVVGNIHMSGAADRTIFNRANNALSLGTNNTTRLHITNAGNVGIGTTTPQALLTSYPGNVSTLGAKTSTGFFIENNGNVGNISQIGLGYTFSSTNHPIAIAAVTTSGAGSTRADLVFATRDLTTDVAPTERLRIDSSGRLLVGTSTSRSGPSFEGGIQLEGINTGPSTFTVHRNFASATANAPASIVLSRSGASSLGSDTTVVDGNRLGQIWFAGANGSTTITAAAIYAEVDGTVSGGGANDMPGRLVFSTTADGASSPTERMRITNGGLIDIGGLYSVGANAIRFDVQGSNFSRNTTSSATQIAFVNPNGTVGTITTSGSATAYNTSSDYRLKENVAAVTDGITRLQQLKPSRFNFIADPNKTVDGFLAHEVQTIVPEAITGEKDAVDDEGNPIYQGIDQSKLVPLLTAALQEAVAKIESLEARLTAAGI